MRQNYGRALTGDVPMTGGGSATTGIFCRLATPAPGHLRVCPVRDSFVLSFFLPLVTLLRESRRLRPSVMPSLIASPTMNALLVVTWWRRLSLDRSLAFDISP